MLFLFKRAIRVYKLKVLRLYWCISCTTNNASIWRLWCSLSETTARRSSVVKSLSDTHTDTNTIDRMLRLDHYSVRACVCSLLCLEGFTQEARRGETETVEMARGTSQRASARQRTHPRLIGHRAGLTPRSTPTRSSTTSASTGTWISRSRTWNVLRQPRPDEGAVRHRAWPWAGIPTEAVETRALKL